MRVAQCNLEISKINSFSFQHSTNINLQRILLHLMKASYIIVNACDELTVADETEESNKWLTIMVDSAAVLELSTIELNTLRRDLMKHKFPDHLKELAKQVPSDSAHLFGDNIQKLINHIAATNISLEYQRQFSRQSNGYQSRSNRNPTKPTMPPREALLKGRRAATSRTNTEGREIKCR